MRHMGWSWEDLQATPQRVVDHLGEILEREFKDRPGQADEPQMPVRRR